MKIDIVKNNKIISSINDEYVLYNSNILKDKLDIAINLVKAYILDKELLIVGGTAIDYALRLKNLELYDLKYNIQDFDIISPNNIEHANNIGIILCNNGFNNISIIPAIHNTTVRVQYLGYTVFDSTYIPEYIYNDIPFLIYNNYKIIDPNFQKINQYLSVSLLFNITGPNYNIFNRFKKDIERFNLLDHLYQIENFKTLIKENIINLKTISINIPKKLINNLKKNEINNFNTIYSDICFHGELAYSILYAKFKQIIDTLNDTLKNTLNDTLKNTKFQEYLNDITIKPSYEMDSSDDFDTCYKIKFQIPNNEMDHSFTLINNNDMINDIYHNLQKYNNLSDYKKFIGELDIIPKHYNFHLNDDKINCYIYDLYGEIPSINTIHFNELDITLCITNYNYILAYFLYNYYKTKKNKNNTFLNYYYSLYSIIKIIKILKENELIKENELFDFSIITLNDINLSSNDYNFFKNFSNLVKTNTNLDILPPKNYLELSNCAIKKKYNYNSIYYNTSYIEIENTNYKEEVEKLKNILN